MREAGPNATLPLAPPMRRPLACLALVVAIACTGDSASSGQGGTVIIGTPVDADALLMPLVNGQQGRVVAELLFDRLAEIGRASCRERV